MDLTWDRIVFYRWKANNLGDRPLNDWIVRRWFTRLPAEASDPIATLMGIGSILGHRCLHLPSRLRNAPWLVFGSGHHHERVDIPPRSIAFALRGPLTAEIVKRRCPEAFRFGFPPLADPAVLLPRYLARDVDSTSGHCPTIYKFDWTDSPETPLGFTTRTDDFVGWMRRLWASERISTHSLHAALLADAYGIPWRALRWEPKWADAFASLGIFARPRYFGLSDRDLLAQRQAELESARKRLICFVDEGRLD